MSGHSKWNNIKRKKEKADGAKARVFTRAAKEISVAVKEGGSADPDVNARLRDAIAKAKANNVPNDNIKRIIEKAGANTASYEKVTYEGYGPGGVALIIEALTDNRNRTAAAVRHALDKFGGNLGSTGCVSFIFTQKGVIELEDEDGINGDKLLEDAMEVDGVEDVEAGETDAEITTAPNDLIKAVEGIKEKGYTVTSAEVAYVPSTRTRLDDPDQLQQLSSMLEQLDEDDDVQGAWHNLENEEDMP